MASTTAPTLYPNLRYRDPKTAIDFLISAFGFAEHAVHTADDGSIVHAELTKGNGMVMVGTASTGSSPFDTGKTCVYVVVDDADAQHDRAVAAGAEILMPLTDQPYGSRDFAASDPEGNVWAFGTYLPEFAPAP